MARGTAPQRVCAICFLTNLERLFFCCSYFFFAAFSFGVIRRFLIDFQSCVDGFAYKVKWQGERGGGVELGSGGRGKEGTLSSANPVKL